MAKAIKAKVTAAAQEKAAQAVTTELGEKHAVQERTAPAVTAAQEAVKAAEARVAAAQIAASEAKGMAAILAAKKAVKAAQAELATAKEKAARPVNAFDGKVGGVKSSQGTLPAALVSIATTAYSRDALLNPLADTGLLPAAPSNWGELATAGHKHGATPQAFGLNALVAIGATILGLADDGDEYAKSIAAQSILDATEAVYDGAWDCGKGSGSRPQRAAAAKSEGRSVKAAEAAFAEARAAAFDGNVPTVPAEYEKYLAEFFGLKTVEG